MAIRTQDSKVFKAPVETIAVNVIEMQSQRFSIPLGAESTFGTPVFEQPILDEVALKMTALRHPTTRFVEFKRPLDGDSAAANSSPPEFTGEAFGAGCVGLSAGLGNRGSTVVGVEAGTADFAGGVAFSARFNRVHQFNLTTSREEGEAAARSR